MKHVICAVRDRAADTFGRPFFVAAVGAAIRSFSDEVNREDKDNQLFVHPEDFDLYEIGSYDDDSGDLVAIKPRMVAVGKDIRVAVVAKASANVHQMRESFGPNGSAKA